MAAQRHPLMSDDRTVPTIDTVEVSDAYIDGLEDDNIALAARVERLQRLWQAWSAAAGYSTTSRRWAVFADALKACEDHGDLLPVEGTT